MVQSLRDKIDCKNKQHRIQHDEKDEDKTVHEVVDSQIVDISIDKSPIGVHEHIQTQVAPRGYPDCFQNFDVSFFDVFVWQVFVDREFIQVIEDCISSESHHHRLIEYNNITEAEKDMVEEKAITLCV